MYWAGQESCRGGALFVREDFGIADAGVVVNGYMDVVVSDSASLDLL